MNKYLIMPSVVTSVFITDYVCATCLGSKGPIEPEKVIASTGQSVTKPSKPVVVLKLHELEKNIYQYQKNLK